MCKVSENRSADIEKLMILLLLKVLKEFQLEILNYNTSNSTTSLNYTHSYLSLLKRQNYFHSLS